LKERPSPNERLNTEGNDPLSKRGKNFQMKLNPNFMKKGKNTDVIVSPRSGILNKKRNSQDRRSFGGHSDKEPKVRVQEEVTPAELYNKK
jgi:hypothetical protein